MGGAGTGGRSFEPEVQALSDDELRKRSLSLRYRAKSREPLTELLPEAYALVREAGGRTIDLRHFDVQLLGGIALHHRSIAEMQTGEGKTLTATLPLYLAALTGQGVHLATVNDYLAERDADWMAPIYDMLGMTVGVMLTPMNTAQRRKAYACDITYGTAKEFGFDFLRDRLLLRRTRKADRLDGPHARPSERLVRATSPCSGSHTSCWSTRPTACSSTKPARRSSSAPCRPKTKRPKPSCIAGRPRRSTQFVEDEHYTYDHEKKTAELTAAGRRLVRNLPRTPACNRPACSRSTISSSGRLRADRAFLLDRHYVVREGEIVIVDEFTGRMSEGRKWRDGLHQAIEAKEEVEVTIATGHAARVTIQDYFLRYPHLAGMTGTAVTSAGEMHKIYRLRVVPIPTNRPPIRKRQPDRIFGTAEAKNAAIVEEVKRIHAEGRPVLIGTRSIDKSEQLSTLMTAAGIPHEVLNARQIAAEAEIIAHAGEPGTSHRLDEHGGPRDRHSVGRRRRRNWRTARHPHRNARCGSHRSAACRPLRTTRRSRHVLPVLGPRRRYPARGAWPGEGSAACANLANSQPGPFDSYARAFRKSQRIIERRHFRDRRALMYHEKERKKIQKQMGQDPYLDSPS